MSGGYPLKHSIVIYVKEDNGIGESKHEAKKLYGGVSPKFHSYETKERYLAVINNLKEWLLERGVKRTNRVTQDHLLMFLEEKAKDVCESTMELIFSALRKFFNASPWRNQREGFYQLIDIYHDYFLSLSKPSGEAKPFSNPVGVIEKIRFPEYRSVATIEYRSGARIDEVPKVVESFRYQGRRNLYRLSCLQG